MFFAEQFIARPDYEERPEQVQMATAVAQALSEEELLVVEAGTGTGKSLAYLIPSLIWALDHQKPVVISTRTLNLQQQLLEKDIPLLRQLYPEPFRATAARGWSNYVCLRRLQAVQTPEVAAEAEALNEHLNQGGSGTRQHLRVSDALWNEVKADSAACNKQFCPHYQECYFFKDRRELECSQIIVANHSLVMANLAIRRGGGQGILPEPGCWVLDEGHHLEEIANEHLGRSVSRGDLFRLRQNVYDPHGGRASEAGWLVALRGRLSALPVSVDLKMHLLHLVDQSLLAALPTFYRSGEEFFEHLSQAVEMQGQEGRITLHSDFFHTPEGELCRHAASVWAGAAEAIEAGCQLLHRALTENELEAQQGGLAELQALLERLRMFRSDLEFCLFPESPDWVYWAQVGAEDVLLGATPLDIGATLSKEFFAPARSVVITSATLALNEDLSFYEERVGLQEHAHRVNRLCLPSPFDYPRQAYLGVATDLLDPNQPAFWTRSAAPLAWLAGELGGRTFVLATSFASLRLARQHLEAPLRERGVRLLVQGEAPPALLLEEFRRDPRAVLIGADSFWEGVDVPGDGLQCVVLTRLPFRVPSDPIVSAHCRRLQDAGRNPFSQYQMPQAILRFRQGFGRLVRTQRDKGLVLVLDSRLYHKSYGAEFLSALPRCKRRAGALAGLVQDALKWLRQDPN